MLGRPPCEPLAPTAWLKSLEEAPEGASSMISSGEAAVPSPIEGSARARRCFRARPSFCLAVIVLRPWASWGSKNDKDLIAVPS